MRIQFCGGAGEVTGSCTKVEVEQATILIDCGLFQGERYVADKNLEPFPFDPTDIDAVVLTHAHLDHCGRLPKLVHQGFAGAIYATDATRDLAALILLDAAHIAAEEAERHNEPPLFTAEDVVFTLERFVPLPYDRLFRLATGVTGTLYNAGHVLGSSFITVRGEDKTILFSGDIGNYPVPLLPQAEDLPSADALVLESTYGDRAHGPYAEGVKILEQAIRDSVAEKGVVLVPAFSLERTQELLTVIDEAIGAKRVPALSAYLDGPLGIKISRVYAKYHRYFNDPIQALERQEPDHDVLRFPNLVYTETAAQSKLINDVMPPKLIIAGSGMMHGGRILHHLKRYLPNASTRVVIVGYQVAGSLGRRLIDGQKTVSIHGEPVEARAKIVATRAFSSHMDKNQLVDWLTTMPRRPQAIFLNHGDDDARAALAQALRQTGLTVNIPRLGEGYAIG